MAGEPASLRVRFVTCDASIRVTEDAFDVPTRLGRAGLSEVLNHLLGTRDSARLFDFLVLDPSAVSSDDLPRAGQQLPKRLLRKSLRGHLSEHEISSEVLLTIEYALALPRPTQASEHKCPEWIGGLCAVMDGSFLAGGYDGVFRLATPGERSQSDLPFTTEMQAHDGAVKALRSTVGGRRVVSGGMDRTVKVWDCNGKSLVPVAVADGANGTTTHENSVEALAVDDSDRILSGDWDGRLCFWKVEAQSARPVEAKRRRVTGDAAAAEGRLALQTAWKAHNQCMSGVEWMGEDHACTASWDHSVKLWDVEREDCVQTVNTSKVVSCLKRAPTELGEYVVVSGHPDASLRLWDLRVDSSSSSLCVATLTGHNAWVTAVEPLPLSGRPLLASASHDGTLRLWDSRATAKPIISFVAHGTAKAPEKALCMAFQGGETGLLASGGTDGRVSTFSVNRPLS